MKNYNFLDWFKTNMFPIFIIIGSIIDQTTDILSELFMQINAPIWIPTVIRLIAVCIGSFKLYYSTSPKDRKNESAS